ncbi:hypothetical protein Glove_209g170 [Diversispora epigaea]|uniref:Uncharacterized protein n=1 Tax=Diversispora epigaea TaxID=1348612 RepID=A0A397IT44_9GLOM|nr:hypothetical protein Glove_209g170 [Diversispora epigaea]
MDAVSRAVDCERPSLLLLFLEPSEILSLGVFVISRCRYTQEAISYAASSTFNFVLSTEESIINDIQRFRDGPERMISKQISEEVRKNRKGLEFGREN